MDICAECGKHIANSFKCSYCNGTFCKNHAHVDSHQCPNSKRGSYKEIKKIRNEVIQEQTKTTISSPLKKGTLVIITLIILIGLIAS